MLIFFAILVAIAVGLAHLAYWIVLLIGGMQILDSLKCRCDKSRDTPLSARDRKDIRSTAGELKIEANGHTALYNRLIARGKELGI